MRVGASPIPLAAVATIAIASENRRESDTGRSRRPMPSHFPEGEICAPPAPTYVGSPPSLTRSIDSNAKE
jgi:hypothetical protein